MIYGIGTDIIEIERIHKALNRNLKLLDKLFSEDELLVLKEKNYRAESVAGNFCAKEAIVKSLGTGLRGFPLVDVQILRDKLNKPIVVPKGKFKEFCDEMKISDIMVSISHSKNYATATAIAIK
ncbi:MAG: holo-ACP synthase [Peptostreptococcus sp.]|uniref:holo-ACP synthase n=1 Tax=Peptostreptococcus sp. TaxID=1262 RepID=UPI002FCC8E14